MNIQSRYFWFLLAGLIGGSVEIVWIGLYSVIAGMPLAGVGRAIAATVYPGSAAFQFAPAFGLLVHLALSILLAFGFGVLLWPVIGRAFNRKSTALIASVVTLVAVWKVNFFILLPVWNPEFVGILPLTVTFASKLFFGLAMGTVLTIYQQKNSLLH